MRKKSTRFLSAALAACMMVSALPVGAFAAAPAAASTESAVSTQAEEEFVQPEYVEINDTVFPGSSFRRYIEENFDNDPKDGKLSIKEREAVTSITLTNDTYYWVRNLRGVEYFPNLESLTCTNVQLSSLDVSKNLKLKELNCNNNNLKKLDVSQNKELTKLYFSDNDLTELDISNNTALTELNCNSNKLKELDVSKHLALTKLYCGICGLSSLNVSKNTELTVLACSYNDLTELDISNNPKLVTLVCSGNDLTKLDVKKQTALTRLECGANELTELDVSNNTALTELDCGSNDLTELNVSNNTVLTKLWCNSNNLTELDVSNDTDLTELGCTGNSLEKLDVSKHDKLQHLYCMTNHLTSLNLSPRAFGERYTNVWATYNQYDIMVNEHNEFDLNELVPNGFDISKTSNWQGGTANGMTLTVNTDSNAVTYQYSTGNSRGGNVTFTLDVVHHYRWEYDNAKHWRVCLDADCPGMTDEQRAEGPHTFASAKDAACADGCGYTRPLYTVTVKNATAILGDEELNAPVAAGTKVTLTADTTPEDKELHGWKLYKVAADGTETEITDTTGLLSGSVRVVTLTVPAYNVKAVPDYADILYDVNPVKCTVTLNNVEVPAAAKGDVITATPNEQGPGKKFTGWTVTKTVNGVVTDITADLRDVSQNGLIIAELTMPAADVTIEALFDDDSLLPPDQPVVTDDGSGDIVAGVVIGGIAAVGAYEVGTGLYRITQMDDVAMPTNRLALAKLLWERAGKPEPESTALYSDISAEDTDAQKAARWAVEQELLKNDTNEDEQKFHPAFPVSKLRVCLTWEKAKQKGLFDTAAE